MNYSLAMRFFERFADLNRDAGKFSGRERAALQALGECFAFDVLHDQIIGAVLAANVIEGANIWMVETGYGAGFAFKTLAHFRRIRQMLRQNFQRDGAVEPGVFRTINFAHAARTDGGDDLVRA